jgi:hypothetical protein
METMVLRKMKQGMSFGECLYAITEGNVGLITMLPSILEKASEILQNQSKAYCGVLTLFDAMEIYGDDLAYLFKFCEEDKVKMSMEIKMLVIVWSYEVGIMNAKLGRFVPNYAKLATIKEIINTYRLNRKVNYPFEDAQNFIERNSRLRF